MNGVLDAYSVTAPESGDVAIDVVITGARMQLRLAFGAAEIPAGLRERVVDAAFAAPGAARARVLRASIPAGDVELLDALRLRCCAMRARSSGTTCLVDGVLGGLS